MMCSQITIFLAIILVGGLMGVVLGEEKIWPTSDDVHRTIELGVQACKQNNTGDKLCADFNRAMWGGRSTTQFVVHVFRNKCEMECANNKLAEEFSKVRMRTRGPKRVRDGFFEENTMVVCQDRCRDVALQKDKRCNGKAMDDCKYHCAGLAG